MGMRILIVEDEFIIAMDMQERLTALGCEVAGHVPSGEEAVESAQALHPDAIFMDVRLNGEMSGIEAARRIHEILDVPIVFVSGQADSWTTEAASAVRHSGYLTKPFNDAQVAEVIASLRASADGRDPGA